MVPIKSDHDEISNGKIADVSESFEVSADLFSALIQDDQFVVSISLIAAIPAIADDRVELFEGCRRSDFNQISGRGDGCVKILITESILKQLRSFQFESFCPMTLVADVVGGGGNSISRFRNISMNIACVECFHAAMPEIFLADCEVQRNEPQACPQGDCDKKKKACTGPFRYIQDAIHSGTSSSRTEDDP